MRQQDMTANKHDYDSQYSPIDACPSKPGLLVAYSPSPAKHSCFVLGGSTVVGSDSTCELVLQDGGVSFEHFRIIHARDQYWIENLTQSRTTLVDGVRLTTPKILRSPALIRVGRTLLVFHERAGYLGKPAREAFGFIGPFHIGPIVDELETAAQSGRHILLVGPLGSGKKLAAQALWRLLGRSSKPFRMINVSNVTSTEQAARAFFGVSGGRFSRLESWPGLIDEVSGGILFVDEVHKLPQAVQEMLLEVIEEGTFSRVGDPTKHEADVRFVFASNASSPTYSLNANFLASLRISEIPSLEARMADVPAIFENLLRRELFSRGIDVEYLLGGLDVKHYEKLSLSDLQENNVRGIILLVKCLVNNLVVGMDFESAISRAFEACKVYSRQGMLEESDTLVLKSTPQLNADTSQ